MDVYIVSNCEISSLNGRYIYSYYDLPFYEWTNESTSRVMLVREGNTEFHLGRPYNFEERCTAYSTETTIDDDALTWEIYNDMDEYVGVSGVSIIVEQSGTTHEGEATLSSLSYLRTKKA